MSEFECQETLFQLWVVDRLVQRLKQKDPALPNHDRHISAEIARLASNIIIYIDKSFSDKYIIRRPGSHRITSSGDLLSAEAAWSTDPYPCTHCHVVLQHDGEAYPVPAPKPQHWRAACKTLRAVCQPCHDLICACGWPRTPGLVYAKASYEQ